MRAFSLGADFWNFTAPCREKRANIESNRKRSHGSGGLAVSSEPFRGGQDGLSFLESPRVQCRAQRILHCPEVFRMVLSFALAGWVSLCCGASSGQPTAPSTCLHGTNHIPTGGSVATAVHNGEQRQGLGALVADWTGGLRSYFGAALCDQQSWQAAWHNRFRTLCGGG